MWLRTEGRRDLPRDAFVSVWRLDQLSPLLRWAKAFLQNDVTKEERQLSIMQYTLAELIKQLFHKKSLIVGSDKIL